METPEDAPAGEAASTIDVALFTKTELQILEAAVAENDFTTQDLVDLTAKTKTNVRKYLHQIRQKIPDLLRETGEEVSSASAGRRNSIWSVSDQYLTPLRDHFSTRRAETQSHQEVVETLPAIQYASELLDGLTKMPGEDITRDSLAQRVNGLVARAEVGQRKLKEIGRPISPDLQHKIDSAKHSLQKVVTEMTDAGEQVANDVSDAVDRDANGGKYGPIPDLVTRSCNAFADSGPNRVGEIATAVIGSGERPALRKQRREIGSAWVDPVFRTNLGWAVTASVQNAARVPLFDSLSQRLLGSLRKMAGRPDLKFAKTLNRLMRTDGISHRLKQDLSEASGSLMPRGYRPDNDLLTDAQTELLMRG